MRSGDRPGLQNRRAAGFLSPVGSTPTRFRHYLSTTYIATVLGSVLEWLLDSEMPPSTLRVFPR